MSDKAKNIRDFCCGFFGMLATPLILFFVGIVANQSDAFIIILFCMIPFALLGIVLWSIFKKKKKMISLGLLIGGITPFTIYFIISGGCGLVGW